MFLDKQLLLSGYIMHRVQNQICEYNWVLCSRLTTKVQKLQSVLEYRKNRQFAVWGTPGFGVWDFSPTEVCLIFLKTLRRAWLCILCIILCTHSFVQFQWVYAEQQIIANYSMYIKTNNSTNFVFTW